MSHEKLASELRRIWLWPGLIVAIVVAADQVAKGWVLRNLGPIEGTSRPLLEPWLLLTLVKNTGVSFGMFRDFPQLFTVTSVLISIAALYFYRVHLPNRRPIIQLCTGLIVGGAVGNIIDRLRYGYVVDFIHVTWFPGIFNLADSAITVGVTLLACYLIFNADAAQPGDATQRADWPGPEPGGP